MMRVSNSMQANNLINPLCLHDWIGYLAITEDWLALYTESSFDGGYSSWGVMDLGGTGDQRYAWFARDPSVVADAYPANRKVFGDPAIPAHSWATCCFIPAKSSWPEPAARTLTPRPGTTGQPSARSTFGEWRR